MMPTAIITKATCRFKTKRKGPHIGIARADICGDCLIAMQESLQALFTGGPTFCHECGKESKQGDLLSYFYRDTEAMIMCEDCSKKFAPKITSELDANAAEKQALVIKSVDAREAVWREPDPNRKMTLWRYWRDRLGPRRKA